MRQFNAELNGLRLRYAFSVIPWREVQQAIKEEVGLERGFERRRFGGRGVLFAPNSINQTPHSTPKQTAYRLSIGTRACEQVVEQNNIRCHLSDLIALCLERALRGRNEKAKDES